MRVQPHDYLLYALNYAVGTAKDAIVMLDDNCNGDYEEMKQKMIY
jgi:hypothetical protein